MAAPPPVLTLHEYEDDPPPSAAKGQGVGSSKRKRSRDPDAPSTSKQITLHVVEGSPPPTVRLFLTNTYGGGGSVPNVAHLIRPGAIWFKAMSREDLLKLTPGSPDIRVLEAGAEQTRPLCYEDISFYRVPNRQDYAILGPYVNNKSSNPREPLVKRVPANIESAMKEQKHPWPSTSPQSLWPLRAAAIDGERQPPPPGPWGGRPTLSPAEGAAMRSQLERGIREALVQAATQAASAVLEEGLAIFVRSPEEQAALVRRAAEAAALQPPREGDLVLRAEEPLEAVLPRVLAWLGGDRRGGAVLCEAWRRVGVLAAGGEAADLAQEWHAQEDVARALAALFAPGGREERLV